MTVKELVTKWGFDINDKPLQDLDASIGNLKGSLAVVGAAVAAAAGTMFGFAKLTANAGDAAAKMAQRAGVGVEELQELAYAAGLADVNQQQLGKGLMDLSRKMDEASKGNQTAADAFRELGITYRDSSGQMLGSDVVLKKIADKFKVMPDGAKKTALAMKLMSEAGAQMIPLLNAGSDEMNKLGQRARELGVVLTESEAKAGEKFNDSMTEATAAVTGLRNIVGNGLLPVLTPLIEQFTEWVRLNRQIIAQKISVAFQSLSKFIGITVVFAERLWRITSALVNVFGGFERVATFTGYALAALSAGYILSAIGGLTVAVMGLAGAFTLANAAALAIPILIGAAVVAVGLIIEDIVAFFRGEDSVTGVIVDQFAWAWGWVTDRTSQFFKWFSDRVSDLALWFGEKIQAMFAPFKWLLEKVGGGAMKIFGPDTAELVAKIQGQRSVSGAMGVSPMTSPAAGSSSVATNTMNNQIQTPITINVGADANASDVRSSVKGGVDDALGPLLRGAARTYQGAGGY